MFKLFGKELPDEVRNSEIHVSYVGASPNATSRAHAQVLTAKLNFWALNGLFPKIS